MKNAGWYSDVSGAIWIFQKPVCMRTTDPIWEHMNMQISMHKIGMLEKPPDLFGFGVTITSKVPLFHD